MENGIITLNPMTKNSVSDNREIVPVQESKKLIADTLAEKNHERFLFDAEKISKLAGYPNEKNKIIEKLILDFPDINLYQFYETYVRKSNSFDIFENETFDSIDHISKRRKARKVKRLDRRIERKVSKGKTSKISFKRVQARKKFVTTGKKADLKSVRRLRRTTVKKTLASSVLLPLMPFKRPMIRAIKEKSGRDMGSSKMIDIVKIFSKEVLKKDVSDKSDFESFDNIYDYKNHYGANWNDHFVADTVSVMVKEIIAFFKNLKEKKERGEKMTDGIVNQLAVAAVSVNDQLKAKANNEVLTSKSPDVFGNEVLTPDLPISPKTDDTTNVVSDSSKTILYVAVAVVALLILSK